MSEPLSGLFINCVEAQDSIFASGKMAYDALAGSDKYSLDYIEITRDRLDLGAKYDFYFFNYHFHTMAWLETRTLRQVLPGVVITMVLEVSPNDPFVLCSPDDFDIYCVLDPTLNIERENVFAFPRPLEDFGAIAEYQEREIPLIGSFGLGTQGKGFEHVIDAVNLEFDRADVRINIPFAAYWDKGESYARQLATMCKDRAKSGINVTVTHDYMTKPELIEWCSQNTINCFFYDRNLPGLAATTDQAIASGRPLLISKNNTFRHIQQYIKPFPYQTISQAIDGTGKNVAQIQHDWSSTMFRERFEGVLKQCVVEKSRKEDPASIVLPVKPRTFSDIVQPLRDKAAIRTRLKKLDKKLGRFKRKPKPPRSRTESGEDVIVFELLNELSIQNIHYLEIGAAAGSTALFYEKGCSGVLVEADADICEKLRSARPRDRVINTSKNLNLSELIKDNLTECPDLVSINSSEVDREVLESLGFELFNPAAFCVRNIATRDDIRDVLATNGYSVFRESSAHTIFVNTSLFDFYEYQKSHSL